MSVERVQETFREVFGDEAPAVFPEMTAIDVAGWDSFNHINLIVALEEAFQVTVDANATDGSDSANP